MQSPRGNTPWIIFAVLGFALLCAAGIYYLTSQSSQQSITNKHTAALIESSQKIRRLDASIDDFLSRHWQHPIAPQGSPPAHYSALEGSLAPESCGGCHQEQYSAWKNSLHSQTISAGILWQFNLLPPAEANQCLDCHAPLAEQRALIAQSLGWSNAPASKPPAYIPENLGHQGLVCAACHVRAHERFGPEPQKVLVDDAPLPHNAFTATPEFSDSRFCSTCHQFPENGPRTKNKLREDTYAQWQASEFSRGENPMQCQSCHMPNRKHEWKGIHDATMVAQALTSTIVRDKNHVTVTLTNSGAGHHFPTYMVPKIYVRTYLVEDKKQTLLNEEIIGWQVDINLTDEIADQRLASGASRQFVSNLPQQTHAEATIRVELDIAPREHYERTFEFVLAQRDKLSPETLALLEQAYREAKATRYQITLIEQSLSQIPQ